MQEIKKSGFVCKVAYHLEKEENIPKRVTKCRLYITFILKIFIIPWAYFCLLFFGVFCAFLFGIAFLFAMRPTLLRNDDTSEAFIYYERWPRIKGYRIWPICPVLFALIAYVCLKITSKIIDFAVFNSNFWFFIAGMILIFGVFLRTKKTLKSGILELKTFLKAKKEKICPIIKIVD